MHNNRVYYIGIVVVVVAVLLRLIVRRSARDKDDDELVWKQLPIPPYLIVAHKRLSFNNRNAKNSLIVRLQLHTIHAYIRRRGIYNIPLVTNCGVNANRLPVALIIYAIVAVVGEYHYMVYRNNTRRHLNAASRTGMRFAAADNRNKTCRTDDGRRD